MCLSFQSLKWPKRRACWMTEKRYSKKNKNYVENFSFWSFKSEINYILFTWTSTFYEMGKNLFLLIVELIYCIQTYLIPEWSIDNTELRESSWSGWNGMLWIIKRTEWEFKDWGVECGNTRKYSSPIIFSGIHRQNFCSSFMSFLCL